MIARLRDILLLPVLVLLALLLAVRAGTPPPVVPAGASAVDFSAPRAMATIAALSRTPHPIGSREAAAVRATIAGRLRAAGLTVETFRAVGAAVSPAGPAPSARAGRVATLVATLPGIDRALPAVAIMAHTDSVPDSFGAADDGAGVGVALETVRAIAAAGRPRRDVMLILTDGEEGGLLGARAFFADAARAGRIGAIVNVDSRGTSGIGTMFETRPGSGGLLRLYRATATHRFAHSAAVFLYRRLPNSTDLSALGDRAIPALNFAFIDGEFDYHTPRDRLASLDPRTVQSLGDQILPVVRAVALASALPAAGEDGVFADAPGLVALRYPAWAGWPLLGLALLLAGWGVRGVRVAPAARAAAAALAVGVGAALAARTGYALTDVGEDWGEHHRIMAAAGRYEAALAFAALAMLLGVAAAARAGRGRVAMVTGCIAAGVVAVLLGRPPAVTAGLAIVTAALAWFGLARPLDAREARAGSLAIALILSAALQALAPALTPLLLWATLAAAGGAAAARLPGGRWIAAALALLPLAYVLLFAHAVLLALGIPTPEAIGIFALAAAILLLPLAGVAGRWPPLALGMLAAILLLGFRWGAATERHPALSQVYGVVDADGRSWRMSPLERPDAWTRAALGPAMRVRMPALATDAVWRAPAAPIAVAPPGVALARTVGGFALTLAPARGGQELRVLIALDRPLSDVTVTGAPLPAFASRPGAWRLRWLSAGEPATLRFRAAPGTRLTVEAVEYAGIVPALPPRPVNIVPWLGSDRVIATTRRRWRL